MSDNIVFGIIFGSVLLGIMFFVINYSSYCVSKVDFKELIKMVNKNPKIILIDVRSQEEYLVSHIRGAVNIDYYKSFKTIIKKYNKNCIYILYCQTEFRSLRAYQYMKALGFKNIYVLKGGFSAVKNLKSDLIFSYNER